jgi:hypothetical protein
VRMNDMTGAGWAALGTQGKFAILHQIPSRAPRVPQVYQGNSRHTPSRSGPRNTAYHRLTTASRVGSSLRTKGGQCANASCGWSIRKELFGAVSGRRSPAER